MVFIFLTGAVIPPGSRQPVSCQHPLPSRHLVLSIYFPFSQFMQEVTFFHNSCKKLHFFTFLPSRHLFSLHLNPILLWVPSLLPHHLPGWFFNLSFLINSLPGFFLLSFSCSLSITSLFIPSSFVKFLSITSPG